MSGILYILCNLSCLANSHNSDLGTQDSGDEVCAPDVPDTRYTEGSVLEVRSGELPLIDPVPDPDDLLVDLKYALVLDPLYVGDSEPVLGVDGNGEVVVALDHVLLDVALVVGLRVEVRVQDRVVQHRQRGRLHEEGQHCQVRVLFLQSLPKSKHLSGIDLISEHKEWYGARLSHGLSHGLLHPGKLLDLILRFHPRQRSHLNHLLTGSVS